MTRHSILATAMLVFGLNAFAQDDLEDLPFDDLPDPAEAAPPESEQISQSEAAPKSEEQLEEESLAELSEDLENSNFDDPDAETEVPTEVAEPSPEAAEPAEPENAPAQVAEPEPTIEAADPEASQELTLGDSALPSDAEALEQKAQDAGVIPAPLVVDSGEPGSALKPSEQFYRVPLKPRMSDANWKRWAGPALEKNYKILRGDTLWAVSDRLFGNPYLWPKVWQLNAHLENPNIIAPGLELQFTPGNPNSAPEFAFRYEGDSSFDEMPLTVSTQKLGLMDRIEQALQSQYLRRHPPFQYFLWSEAPESIAKVEAPVGSERIYFTKGETVTVKADDGVYSVIRATPVKGRFFSAYRVKWLGSLEVKNKKGLITQGFHEIQKGDLIVTKDFLVSPLALHEEKLTDAEAKFVALEEGAQEVSSELRLLGAHFDSAESGPRIGALMKIKKGDDAIATVLLIDRDQRMGTFWVVENSREIDIETDKLE